MNKTTLLISLLSFNIAIKTNADCFLAKESNHMLKQEGDYNKRYSPCCSFNIALGLMGYQEKILIDETCPEFPYKKEYASESDKWEKAHNPTTWIKNSCVWYSRVLTKKLGFNKFKYYIDKLNYGNKDLSGDKSKNNGLTKAWLSSSLEISPKEQLDFIEKFFENKLPFNAKTHKMTKKILFVEDLTDGWKLYEKTGSGRLLSNNRDKKLRLQHGWFIGCIEKNGKRILFVNHIVDSKKQPTAVGIRAKLQAKEKLLQMIRIK